jgi:hypothetical protein
LAKKLSFNEVKEIYQNAGCELLSDCRDYHNSRSKLEYKCSCGNLDTKAFINFKAKPRCLSCASKNAWAERHPCINDVKKYFETQGCVLLSTEFVNSTTKLEFICTCGNTYHQSLFDFKNGRRCWECGRKKLANALTTSITEVENTFKDKGCQLLSEEYNPKKRLEYIAKCGHKSTVKYDDFKQGSGINCAKCTRKLSASKRTLDYDYVKKYFSDQGCELLEDSYVNNSTKMKYKCECGNISTIIFNSFQKGARCRDCKIEKISEKNRKYGIGDVKEIFADRDCVLLEQDYKNTNTKLRYICSCGTTYAMTLTGFLSGYGCPECKRNSLSGPNNYGWKPELTDAERARNKSRLSDTSYKEWRYSVFKRDLFTCQCCRKRGKGELNAHHLDGYNWCKERRTDVDNGVTLCKECHIEFHAVYGKGYNTREQYVSWIRNKRKQGA